MIERLKEKYLGDGLSTQSLILIPCSFIPPKE